MCFTSLHFLGPHKERTVESYSVWISFRSMYNPFLPLSTAYSPLQPKNTLHIKTETVVSQVSLKPLSRNTPHPLKSSVLYHLTLCVCAQSHHGWHIYHSSCCLKSIPGENWSGAVTVCCSLRQAFSDCVSPRVWSTAHVPLFSIYTGNDWNWSWLTTINQFVGESLWFSKN